MTYRKKARDKSPHRLSSVNNIHTLMYSVKKKPQRFTSGSCSVASYLRCVCSIYAKHFSFSARGQGKRPSRQGHIQKIAEQIETNRISNQSGWLAVEDTVRSYTVAHHIVQNKLFSHKNGRKMPSPLHCKIKFQEQQWSRPISPEKKKKKKCHL